MLADRIHAYTHGLDEAVAAAVKQATARVPALAERIAEAHVASVTSVADLNRVPVLTKDDLIAAQRANPPFGGAVAPQALVHKVFASPGPLYEPQVAGTDPWRWAPALRAAGIGAGDTVLNCFSYHLTPAGAMFEEAALAVGATVVPAGVGNMELQVQVAVAVQARGYVGLPSYLKALVDTADAIDLRFPVRHALVTAEPLPDSLRSWLTEHVPTVHQAYGTAEAGLLGYETAPGSGLALPAGVLIQICDLGTGQPHFDDTIGQVVVTLLRPDQPLVRFGTGDLSAWTLGADGSLRLAGVLGRVGEAIKVRGIFLHPRQAAAALAGEPGVTAHRFVIDRTDHRDDLRCEIVATPDSDPHLSQRVHDLIRAHLRLAADVVCVQTLPDGPTIHDQRDWS
ncbi:phenylacetate--CoA ligase family protein [Virgisporangium aurantiacum]|uniref:Coenzyme F390 synthetase n=1 Tax=Virgisporangium aurantiacum TaxID=175570 RepID=A0A8J3ZIC5_9ACTN|nr:AMP-binding protein [Virgisporangium aurantiacum]GIJ64424.1 coenzyme F390 synthetase [Virgisporangium aurantiacum]